MDWLMGIPAASSQPGHFVVLVSGERASLGIPQCHHAAVCSDTKNPSVDQVRGHQGSDAIPVAEPDLKTFSAREGAWDLLAAKD